jgi:anthranilate synthase/aminodeoxychorismate synthase-like glutamine amidotransferase
VSKKTKIILVDLKDSFTYNLVQLLENLGASVYVRPYTKDVVAGCEEYDKILLSPGPGTPEDYPALFDLIHTFQNTKPILGICLGHQAIGTFYGAKLGQLAKVQHGQTVLLFPGNGIDGTLLEGMYLPKLATLYHSWALKSEDFPSCLKISCTTLDGTIMGVKHKEYEVEGFQFHPESYMSEIGKDLLHKWLSIPI